MTKNIKLKLNQRVINLAARNLLGSGGEANVYRYKDSAVKVFHDLNTLTQLNPGISRGTLQTRQAEKENKLKALPPNLPTNVIAANAFVYSEDDRFAGYMMPRVNGGYDIRLLSRRSYREGVVSNAKLVQLFIALQLTLDSLHQQAVIVGDLNDNNVLFRGDEIYLIDIDSMQFSGFVCPVATEQFLDPRLYGVDLTLGPVFSKESDYFAIAAMLFRSCLYVGAFGGRHPSLRTWLRRGEQRVSVLNQQVSYPNAAVHPDILPDNLLDYFYQTFEKDYRNGLPLDLLRSLHWQRCRHCGKEYARAICPCQSLHGAVVETSVVHHEVRLTTLFKTNGRIHAIQQLGEKLFYAYESNQTIYRENGERICQGPLLPGMQIIIAGKATWIASKYQAVRIQNGNVLERRATTQWMNESVVASLGNELITVNEAGKLRLGQRIIGQVMAGQTWLTCGEEFGLGYYRAGALLIYFMFESDSAHVRELDLPHLPGVLRDTDCYFSQSHVLLIRSFASNGQMHRQALLLKRKDAAVKAIDEYILDANRGNERLLASAEGKLLKDSLVASLAEDGLVLFQVQNTKFVEIKRFENVVRYIPSAVKMFHGPNGSLYLASEREIIRMDLLENSA